MAITPWTIGGPETGGFKGVKLGKNNNDLQPGESDNMYNYFADDKGLTKRKGYTRNNAVELVADTGITGLFRHCDSSGAYHTFAKCGGRVFDSQTTGGSSYLLQTVTEAGDAANQCASWTFAGAGNTNTDSGVLYWKLVDVAGTRTVSVYKNSDGEAANLVAQGSKVGDGEITLTAQNTSGLTGSVTVTYASDDTTLAANTLTFATLSATTEIDFLSWFSRYFFTDGLALYSGATEAAAELSLLDEDGDAISGIKPHGKSILLHKERLWLTRDPNYPTYLWYSQIDYYDRFQCNDTVNSVSWIACDRDDGQAITGFVLHNEQIFVTKRQKSYWVIGEPDAATDGTGSMRPIDGPAVGAYDQKTIISCPDGYVRWFGPDGVWQSSGGKEAVHISENIDYELKQITATNKAKCCAGWYEHFYILAYPYGANVTFCNRAMAFDVWRGQWYPIHNWNISMMTRFEDDTLHGGWADEGYVTTLFNGYNDNSAAISAYYKSRSEGVIGVEQCLYSIRAFNVVSGGGTTTISWASDFDSTAQGSFSTTYTGSGARLGNFVLGTDILIDANDAGSSNPKKRGDNSQRFQQIYFEITESGTAAHGLDYLLVNSYPVRRVL